MIPEQLSRMAVNYFYFDLVLIPFAVALVILLRRLGLGTAASRPPLNQPPWRQAVSGWLWGVAAVALTVAPAWLAGAYSSAAADFHSFNYIIRRPPAETQLFLHKLFLLQSLFEELLYRALGVSALAWLLYWLTGLILAAGAEADGRRRWIWCGLASSFVVSVAFAFAHSHNAGVSALGLTNIMLAGFVLGQLFVNTANVIAPWLFHYSWNMGLAWLGLPVSGYALAPAATAVGFSGAAAGLLSGGRFGPEGSVVSTVVLACIAGWLVYGGLRQARVAAGGTTEESSQGEAEST